MRLKVLSMSDREVADVMQQLATAVKQAVLAPMCVVGLLEGGRQPAELFARQWSPAVPIEFVKIQRPSTSRLKHYVVRSMTVLPRPLVDFSRLCEMQWHEFTLARKRKEPLTLDIDPYVRHFRSSDKIRGASAERPVVIVDDAIDSGTSVATVVEALRVAGVADAAIKLVCITHTLSRPRVRADYCGYNCVAFRFPWSSDYRPNVSPRKPR